MEVLDSFSSTKLLLGPPQIGGVFGGVIKATFSMKMSSRPPKMSFKCFRIPLYFFEMQRSCKICWTPSLVYWSLPGLFFVSDIRYYLHVKYVNVKIRTVQAVGNALWIIYISIIIRFCFCCIIKVFSWLWDDIIYTD